MTIRNLKNYMYAGGDDIARFPVETKERNRNCFLRAKKTNKADVVCFYQYWYLSLCLCIQAMCI